MIRAGFAALLNAQQGIDVVGTADDGEGIVDVVKRTKPDVVLMDIRMPKVNGLDATRHVLAESDEAPRILMLTTFDADEYVFSALRGGARGYLVRDAAPEEIVYAGRAGGAGAGILSPQLTVT